MTDETGDEVVERGTVVFLYSPKVDHEHALGLDDVQRVHIVLEPDGGSRFRRLVVPRKRLPDVRAEGEDRLWSFVDEVGDAPEEVAGAVDREEYETSRGHRVQPGARLAGQGRYAVSRSGAHVHLDYTLELPVEPGEVQEALNLAGEGRWAVWVKDPDAGGWPHVDRAPEYTDELRARFDGRRSIPADPPAFLDHPGTELLLAAAGASAEVELDAGPAPEPGEVVEALGLDPDETPLGPAVEGSWEAPEQGQLPL